MNCSKCGTKMIREDLKFSCYVGPYKYAYYCKKCNEKEEKKEDKNMEEDSALMATEIIIMEAGIMTLRSKKAEEPTMTFNLSLNIRPSVLTVITETLDKWLPDQLEEKEKQTRLTKGISVFLSDMIDTGIVLSAHEIAKEVKTQL